MLQQILIHLIVGMAVGYLALHQMRGRLRRARRSNGGCASGCDGCALARLQRGPCAEESPRAVDPRTR